MLSSSEIYSVGDHIDTSYFITNFFISGKSTRVCIEPVAVELLAKFVDDVELEELII